MRVPAAPRVGLDATGTPAYDAPRVPAPQNAAPEQIQQMGQAMSELGGAAVRVGLHIQDRIDETEVRLGASALSERLTKEWTAYKQQVGQDAVYSRERVWKSVDETRKKLAANLKNNTQREAFEASARQQLSDFNARVDFHFGEQSRAMEYGGLAATAEAEMSARNVALDTNPEEAEAHALVMRAAVVKMARMQGASDASLPGLVRTVNTKMHGDRITELLESERGAEAAAYLKTAVAAGEIEEKERPRLRRMVERAEFADKTERMSQALVRDLTADVVTSEPRPATATDLSDLDTYTEMAQAMTAYDWKAEQSQLYQKPPPLRVQGQPILRPTFMAEASRALRQQWEAGEITATEMDAVFKNVREAHTMARTNDAEQGQAALAAGKQWLMADWTRGVQQLAAADPKLYEELAKPHRNLIPELNAFSDSKGRIPDDPRAWFEAENMSDAELDALLPAELANKFGGLLSTPTIQALLRRQAKARGEGPPELSSAISIDQRVARAKRQLGLLPMEGALSQKDDAARLAAARDWEEGPYNAAIEAESLRLERKLTPMEVQGVLDALVADEVYVKEWGGWSTRKTYLSLVPGQKMGEAFVFGAGGKEVPTRAMATADINRVQSFLRQTTGKTHGLAVVQRYLDLEAGMAAEEAGAERTQSDANLFALLTDGTDGRLTREDAQRIIDRVRDSKLRTPPAPPPYGPPVPSYASRPYGSLEYWIERARAEELAEQRNKAASK